ncbi:hypothetical protein AVEN_161156-1, partial [Araneus ventricosus]
MHSIIIKICDHIVFTYFRNPVDKTAAVEGIKGYSSRKGAICVMGCVYRVSQHHVSELIGGTGCTPMSRNHIATQGRRCFFGAVDGVVRKFRPFLQGIVTSHKDA